MPPQGFATNLGSDVVFVGWLHQHHVQLAVLVLHALATVLHDRERLNRFTAGRRIYQRRGVLVSFAAKKALSDDAPLATVKREFPRGESFAQLEAALAGARGHVVLPARIVLDPMNEKSSVELPPARLLRLAEVGKTNLFVNWDGMVYDSPYGVKMAGRAVPSLASVMSGHSGSTETTFPIDYSVDVAISRELGAETVAT